jgi:hypothetical protein
MPIHINLLAEAQAAEDLRRRDPVKRATFLGSALVVLMLFWGLMGQINLSLANQRLTGVQTAIDAHNKDYTNVVAHLNQIAVAKYKLASLQKLQAARFPQGNLLNALQHITVSGVQLTRMRVEQKYLVTPGTDPQMGPNGVSPGTPGKSRETIVLFLDARDNSPNPGDQVNNFKQAIAGQSYFKTMLDKTNSVELVGLPSPQTGPDGKNFASFTVECHFPEHIR